MGRFTLRNHHDDDNNNDDDDDERQWEFVSSNPAEEGALVLRNMIRNGTRTSNREFLSDTRQRRGMVDYYGVHSSAGPDSRTAFITWKRSILIAIVAWALHSYWPPAPPTSSSMIPSWNDYLTQHTTQLLLATKALAVEVPVHVVQWCWVGFSTDLQLFYEEHVKPMLYRGCRMKETFITSESFQLVADGLIGQETALGLVKNTLQTWKWQPLVEESNPKSKKATESRPLLLFFWTGFSGVGKTTLAKLLVKHVLFDSLACTNPPLLELYGKDFTLRQLEDKDISEKLIENSSTLSLRDDLMHRIVRHVRKNPAGSVILLQGVEHMAPDVLVWLLRTLSSWRTNTVTTVPIPFISSMIDADPQPAPPHESYSCCPNTIFILTSSTIGRNAITRKLRQARGVLPTHHEASFLADLAHEIDLQLDLNSKELLDAIVPFGPLTPHHLSTILRLRLKQLSSTFSTRWKELRITDAAVDALLDPARVEYLEWRKRSSDGGPGELFMTVSLEGASVLHERVSPLWKQVLAQIHECFSLSSSDGSTESTLSSHQLEVARIDWDGTEITLSWCPDTLLDSRESPCNQKCSFTI